MFSILKTDLYFKCYLWVARQMSFMTKNLLKICRRAYSRCRTCFHTHGGHRILIFEKGFFIRRGSMTSRSCEVNIIFQTVIFLCLLKKINTAFLIIVWWFYLFHRLSAIWSVFIFWHFKRNEEIQMEPMRITLEGL